MTGMKHRCGLVHVIVRVQPVAHAKGYCRPNGKCCYASTEKTFARQILDIHLLASTFAASHAQAQVDAAYKDKARWTRMSINSVAGSGKFSSDRTILEYASDIWNVEPCYVPAP